MHTLTTIFKLGMTLFFSLASFTIFVLIELYVVGSVNEILVEKGIVGKFLGLTYQEILWAICYILIIYEAFVFVVNFVWRKIVGTFRDMFSLN